MFESNEKGNVIITVLLALAILGAGSVIISKQIVESKKVVKNLALKKDSEFLDKKIKSYLFDFKICAENFKDKAVNSNYLTIKKKGKDVLKKDGVYLNGSVKILEIQTRPSDILGEFILSLKYEKLNRTQIGGASLTKNFRLKGEISPDNIVQSCYLEDDDAINSAFVALMDKVCNGPGVVATTVENRCTVLEFDPTSTCLPGQAVKGYHLDSSSQKLRLICQDVISQIGTNNNICPLGLKATASAGVFECFTLTDIVSTDSVQVNSGDQCRIGFSQDKIAFICNDSPDSSYRQYICDASNNTWNTTNDCTTLSTNCNSGMAINGEQRCCPSTPTAGCGLNVNLRPHICNTTQGWVQQPGTCSVQSSGCSTPLQPASDGDELCCSATPATVCEVATFKCLDWIAGQSHTQQSYYDCCWDPNGTISFFRKPGMACSKNQGPDASNYSAYHCVTDNNGGVNGITPSCVSPHNINGP